MRVGSRAIGFAVVAAALWMPSSAFADIPANDDAEAAQPVTVGSTFASDTRLASRESGEPGPVSGDTVWYAWTAPTDVQEHVTLTFTASDYPAPDLPCVWVFLGPPPPLPPHSFAILASVVQPPCFSGQSFDSLPGGTYYFQVGSVAGSDGTASIALDATRFTSDIQIKSTVSNAGPDPASVDLSLGRGELQLDSISGATCDDPLCSTASVGEIGAGQSVVVTTRWLAFQTGPSVGVDMVATPAFVDDASPAEAVSSTSVTLPKGDVQLTVGDGGFSFVTARQSTPAGHMWWWWSGASPHTVSDESGLGLFSLFFAPQQFGGFRFFAAGSYPVVDQSTDERMTAVVPISIGPKTGSLGTVFSVSWASRTAPIGLTYEVDLARPHGVFVPWYSGSVRGATFVPDAGVGKYRFRARLVSSGDDTVGSGWVTKAITVT
jgi:hypothetical protein